MHTRRKSRRKWRPGPHQAEGGGGAEQDQAGCWDEGEAEAAGAAGGAEDEEPGAEEVGAAAPDRDGEAQAWGSKSSTRIKLQPVILRIKLWIKFKLELVNIIIILL